MFSCNFLDPDLMKHDGIYSRYFTPIVGGPGVYTFEVTVSDNNNAYTWDQNLEIPSHQQPIIMGKFQITVQNKLGFYIPLKNWFHASICFFCA